MSSPEFDQPNRPSRLTVAINQAFLIRKFIQHDLPTNFTRALTNDERAVIHRMLSMLYSGDTHQNNLVMGDIKDSVLVLWMVVHYPQLDVMNYHQAVEALEARGETTRTDIAMLQQFVTTCFGVDTIVNEGARPSTEPLDLANWILEPPRGSSGIWVQRGRQARWEALDLSMQETHIKYFEFMLANA